MWCGIALRVRVAQSGDAILTAWVFQASLLRETVQRGELPAVDETEARTNWENSTHTNQWDPVGWMRVLRKLADVPARPVKTIIEKSWRSRRAHSNWRKIAVVPTLKRGWKGYPRLWISMWVKLGCIIRCTE